ncbi:MAG: galactokinase, partial [Arcanobacterium sp.]|nr:galactokinase [Arcanobacterium sp.]
MAQYEVEHKAQWLTTRTDSDGAHDAIQAFTTAYGTPPEGVWAAPGRVNLIGEHVDYAGGLCLPFALTQCAYVAVGRNNDGVYRVVDGKRPELPVEIAVDTVGPKSPANWTGYIVGSIWAAAEAGLLSDNTPSHKPSPQGFNIALSSDVPLGAGLSSSAAIECSTAIAAVELSQERNITEEERVALVNATMRAENEVVGATTGGLDQKVSLLGRKDDALAIDFGTGTYRQVPFQIAQAGLAILVTNTNSPHSLKDGQYASRRGVIDAVAAHAGKKLLGLVSNPYHEAEEWAAESVPEGVSAEEWAATVHRRVRHVISEIARTEKAIQQLEAGDFRAFGESMQRSHISLKHDYEVSTPELDTVVEIALAHGALGARMTGGGFGGSAIALIAHDRLAECADAIAEAFAQRG